MKSLLKEWEYPKSIYSLNYNFTCPAHTQLSTVTNRPNNPPKSFSFPINLSPSIHQKLKTRKLFDFQIKSRFPNSDVFNGRWFEASHPKLSFNQQQFSLIECDFERAPGELRSFQAKCIWRKLFSRMQLQFSCRVDVNHSRELLRFPLSSAESSPRRRILAAKTAESFTFSTCFYLFFAPQRSSLSKKCSPKEVETAKLKSNLKINWKRSRNVRTLGRIRFKKRKKKTQQSFSSCNSD